MILLVVLDNVASKLCQLGAARKGTAVLTLLMVQNNVSAKILERVSRLATLRTGETVHQMSMHFANVNFQILTKRNKRQLGHFKDHIGTKFTLTRDRKIWCIQ